MRHRGPDVVPAPVRAAAGRPAAGLFLLLGLAGALLLATADSTAGPFSSVAAAVGVVTVVGSLGTSGVLAWQDSRRRQRSFARSLLDSVRSVLCWLGMLW